MDGGQALLERDAPLARIDQCIRDAVAGAGSLLLLEGPAGIGKTRLMLAVGQHGRDLGLTTLTARCSELERDFGYGLVRQLFEAPLVAASAPERAELLCGAAGHAAPLFGVAAPRQDDADALLDPSFAILHGIYWLCANMGRRRPLLLCVDDVHWADQSSLRFLHYLGRRLEELPIAVVAAARAAESVRGEPLLASLTAGPPAEVQVLAPLSEQAVAELVRLQLGTDVAQAFAAACHQVTGGVPFLVHELARTIAEAGIKPAAAASSQVAAVAPRAVSHSVMHRLDRLSEAARQLAPAAAVLGEADIRLAAGLARLSPAAATNAADQLAAVGILEEGRPLRFVHPIVRAVIEAGLPPGGRAGLHAAAARRLASEGASAQHVAAHLLASDPAGDEWVVDSLVLASRAASASGAPGSAAAYLRRALAEPPSGQLRPEVLLQLGFAESYAGDPQAVTHLGQAVDAVAKPAAQVAITLALGRMLQIEGRNQMALEAFDRTQARLASADRRAALTLEGAALGAAQLDAETAAEAAKRIARLRRLADEEPDVPSSVSARWQSPRRWRTSQWRRPHAWPSARLRERQSCCRRRSTGPRSSTTRALRSPVPNAGRRPARDSTMRWRMPVGSARFLTARAVVLPRPSASPHGQPCRRRGGRPRRARDRASPAGLPRRLRAGCAARDAGRAQSVRSRRGGR